MRDHDQDGEFRDYLVGFALALALTALPFGIVAFAGLARGTNLAAIAAAALAQIVVQFRYFLHIDLSASKREDLQLILFTFLILAIMAGGTMWIIGNLAMRM